MRDNLYKITPITPKEPVGDWVAIDCETGGLDCMRHALLSIAVWSPTDGAEMIYLKPEGEMTPEAEEINHIHPEVVVYGCSADYAARWLSKRIQGKTIVGHSVFFDAGFIAWRVFHLPPSSESAAVLSCLRWADTHDLFKERYPDEKHSLSNAAKVLGIKIDPERLHTADYDAEITGRVFQALMEKA